MSETKKRKFLKHPGQIPSTCMVRDGFLDSLHRHPRDMRVWFDEDPHKYYVDWKDDGDYSCENTLSVTKLCDRFFPQFDPEWTVKRMREKNTIDKNPEYRGKSDDEILEKWSSDGKSAREAGSKIHTLIDEYFNGELTLDHIREHECKIYPEMQQFVSFHEEHLVPLGLKPYRSEWFVFTDERTRIPGAVDMTFVRSADDDGKILHLVIYDWKRTKKIKRYNYMKATGFGPLHELPDTNYYHYTLQLNMYKYILEHFYKDCLFEGKKYAEIKVDTMNLIVLHPNHKSYQIHGVPNLQETIVKLMEIRADELKYSEAHKEPQ